MNTLSSLLYFILTKLKTAADNITSINNSISSLNTDTEALKVLKVATGSFSSLPQTVSNANISSDMISIKEELSDPSAQTGDWTVTTSDGSVSVSGDINGTTTLTLYLSKSR